MSLTEVRDLCRQAGEYDQSGDQPRALAAATQAVVLCRSSPGVYHYAYPLALCALAWLQAGAGEKALAGSLLDEALGYARTLAASDFEHALQVLRQVEAYAVDNGDADLALSLRGEILAMHVQELGDDHPRTQVLGARL